jgi:hypothetical protein
MIRGPAFKAGSRLETGFTGLTGWTSGSENHHLLESLQYPKKAVSHPVHPVYPVKIRASTA